MNEVFKCFLFWGFMLTCSVAEHERRILLTDCTMVQEQLAQMQNTIASLNQTVTNLNQMVAQLTDVHGTKPAFFAILNAYLYVGHDETLKFDLVKTNIGAGYDSFTGIFVAPNPGTYHFTSVVYNAAVGDDVIIQMNKNNDILVVGYSAITTKGESHVMNAVVQLQKGDHIFIKHRGPSVDYIRGDLHSSFSGFEI